MSYNVPGAAGDLNGHFAVDGNGNPAGGESTGTGFQIEWQDGPLKGDGEWQVPNGAFVEDVRCAS